MCGIVGIISTNLGPADLIEFKQMLVKNEVRGFYATGIIVNHKSWRAPIAASDFCKNFFKPIEQFFSSVEPTHLLGHGRLPCRGSPKYNHNNHPLLSKHKRFFLMHNGFVRRTNLGKKLIPEDKQITDTYIILDALDYYWNDNSLNTITKTVKKAYNLFKGGATIVLTHKHGITIITHGWKVFSASLNNKIYLAQSKSFFPKSIQETSEFPDNTITHLAFPKIHHPLSTKEEDWSWD